MLFYSDKGTPTRGRYIGDGHDTSAPTDGLGYVVHHHNWYHGWVDESAYKHQCVPQ
jgi:hypothetical protein